MRNVRRMIGPALLIAGVAALVGTSALAQKGEQGKPAAEEMSRASGPKRVTQRQREDAAARVELATAIVNRLQGEASAKGLNAEWRRAALETLLPLSMDALQQVEQRANSFDSLAAARAEAAEDPNLIGDPNRDLTYTPIVPCRFIDTRVVGGKINGTVPYDTSTNGATYGGVAACAPITVFGVADDEQIGALAMNVTIVDPSVAPGFAAVKPTAAAPLTSLINWYEAGPTVQAANQGIVSTNQAAGTTTNFVIQTSAAVHVIVDLFGAFIEPQATALQTTSTTATVNVAAGGGWNSASAAACPAGYVQTGVLCSTSGFNTLLTDNTNFCGMRNNEGSIQTVTMTRLCARIPGR